LPTPPSQTKTEEVLSAQGTATPKISFSKSTFLFFRSPLPNFPLSLDSHSRSYGEARHNPYRPEFD
jgi:hypothetical protein